MKNNKNKRNIILIPARSGSTRVKNKNLKKINNYPLISFVIRACIKSKSGRVIVSTDSKKIAKIAIKFGAEVPFLRPKSISTSNSSSISCLIHCLKWLKDNEHYEPENIAFCPPTNPFIKYLTLKRMFLLLKKNRKVNSVVTVYSSETHPFNLINFKKNKLLKFGHYKVNKYSWYDFERTQDWPKSYAYSPSVRITRLKYFKKFLNKNLNTIDDKTFDTKNCIGFSISRNEAFDINDNLDFFIANNLFKSLK